MGVGFALLLAAGLCQGSFGLGYKKYNPFSWAAFWGVYMLLCLTVSFGFSWLTAPRLPEALAAGDLLMPLGCGALWGLSAVGFSKGIDKIGMSLVYGISMGISTIVGSILPLLLGGVLPGGNSALMFWTGLGLTLLGVMLVTIAGVRRDGGSGGSASGIVLSVLSGLGSGAMNVGFTAAAPVGEALLSFGYSSAAVSAGKWLPVLAGGCVSSMLWCTGELTVHREWKTLTDNGSLRRCGKLFLVSLVWYAALLLYGLAAELLGELGSTAGWILFNALALMVSVGWGLKTGEWKGSKKGLLFAGCGVLILAWVFTALA